MITLLYWGRQQLPPLRRKKQKKQANKQKKKLVHPPIPYYHTINEKAFSYLFHETDITFYLFLFIWEGLDFIHPWPSHRYRGCTLFFYWRLSFIASAFNWTWRSQGSSSYYFSVQHAQMVQLWYIFKGHFTRDNLWFYLWVLVNICHFQSFFFVSPNKTSNMNFLDSCFLSRYNLESHDM